MTHEFKKIIETAFSNSQAGIKSVLASVVALDGSSYRKPGVRMLISENGKMTGAVSGGCVEKEVFLQSQTVFESGKPKMMTYDGRFRLGCEGILYILLEPLVVSEKFYQKINMFFQNRKKIKIQSYFNRDMENWEGIGSFVLLENEIFPLSKNLKKSTEKAELFEQILKPLFQLVIIGAEHDAVQLCTLSSLLGWEVLVIDSPKDPKSLDNFPGAKNVLHLFPEDISQIEIDTNTAVVLMTHSYVNDLKYLLQIKKNSPGYIGILGSVIRRENLFNDLIEMDQEVSNNFLECIYSPAGLHIGAETPQEIAISIISEILAVTRNVQVENLREISGKIHSDLE